MRSACEVYNDAMPEPKDARRLLELAEQAAIGGDLASADELLRDAARIQEAELGPLHPDLANTLNNLAIVAEKTGRPGDAETFYRRAAAIASASLPADHPMVAESRQNLEDFCREHGLPIAAAVVTPPSAQDTGLGPDTVAPEIDSRAAGTPTVQPVPVAPRGSSRALVWVAIGAIVLVTVAVVVRRPWSSRDTPIAPRTVAAPAATEPTEPAPPPKVVPQPENRAVVTEKRPSPALPAPSSGAVSLVTAQLCQTFSTSGDRWRCDPPRDPAAEGKFVFYTRVRSSRDTTIVHRWYRESTLQQAVKLTIHANASEGYRTYSRQSVYGAGNWRVEVSSASGELLQELRFAVR
jgi:hypothetical protein